MANFYVTYPWKSTLRNCYSVVVAPDEDAAREHLFKTIGDSWAFLYNEFSKEVSIDRFDLEEVPLQISPLHVEGNDE